MGNDALVPPLVEITKWKYGIDHARGGALMGGNNSLPLRAEDLRKEVVDWWKSRPETPARFEKEFKRWKEVNRERPMVLEVQQKIYDNQRKLILTETTKTELGRAYDRLREFGIDALPVIVEKIKAGEYDLLPLFGELTDGIGANYGGTLPERAEYVLSGLKGNGENWWYLLPPVSAAKLKEDKR